MLLEPVKIPEIPIQKVAQLSPKLVKKTPQLPVRIVSDRVPENNRVPINRGLYMNRDMSKVTKQTTELTMSMRLGNDLADVGDSLQDVVSDGTSKIILIDNMPYSRQETVKYSRRDSTLP